MWGLTAIVAAIWVNAIVVSAQSAIPALYRLLDAMRARSAQLPVERDRSTVTIPRTWDDQAVASLRVPLAVASSSPVQIPSRYYYGIPVRPIYKSYAVYHPAGYYKVPSLKGVWYRGPFEHNGSVATLEDWFDPNRLRDDYVPTGFKGYGVKSRAVRGHRFGLKLTADEKKALIAFLKTL
jgi:hypothetical protein